MPVNIVISVNMRNSKTYFFSELGLTKGASIKTCFIGTGAALENLPYDLSDYLSVLEHLVKYLIIWASFYWEVAGILRDIIIIIHYIFGQLFFMPCGITCQVRSKEVSIKEVWYNCSTHRSVYLFIMEISSHSHIKQKQPRRAFLQ